MLYYVSGTQRILSRFKSDQKKEVYMSQVEKLYDKNKALKHFLTNGFDAELQDGIIYVYYDENHNSDTLLDIVMKEMNKINYGCSYGVKARDKKKASSPVIEFEGTEDEDELAVAV